MSVLITEVEIENFRSIRRATVPLNYLSVLVGTNDSGKSNILRALNLFFNGETGRQKPLNFPVDHNVYNRPNRRAKEISVKLRMELPDAYVSTNGDEVIWEKRWRDDGRLVADRYYGIRKTTTRRGRVAEEEVAISSRSNLHSLLRKIEFVYVPAVRDAMYFDFLRGQIHSVIAAAADETFRASSGEFEQSIAIHLAGLTKDIQAELGIASRLALPQDLSHVFERLDFLTGSNEISLDSRGDGIKARHIPLILKFMADQKRSLQTRGAAPISVIWGYEEPENNLEFRNAIGLADELWNFMFDDVAQVIVTSHSPVFYNLVQKNSGDDDYVSCVHVYKSEDEQGTQVSESLGDLDDRLGTTAVLAPRLVALEEAIRNQELAKVRAEQLAAAGRAKIFVEGTSDQQFVTKLFNEFAPGFIGVEADIETLESGAGHSYVGDMLRAWYCVQKHRGARPRAVGLLDADDPGNALRREWNSTDGHADVCKCFVWTKPPHVVRAYGRGLRIPLTLEELYPVGSWEQGEQEGLLEDRALHSILPTNELEAILAGRRVFDDLLEDDYRIYARKKFRQEGKAIMARRIAHWHSPNFADAFGYLRPLVTDVVGYLRG